MRNILKRFDVRVITAMVATLSCVVIISDLLLFRLTSQSQLEGMRDQLKIIAQTTALLIDPDKLQQIPLNKEGLHTPSFDYVEDLIKRVKAANPKIKDIYTLKKVDNSNNWKFIVDLQTNNPADFSSPGDSYDAGRFPEMLKGYNGQSADTKIEMDQFGSTLSGYAPVRNALGQPVALLGIDYDAADVHAMYAQALHQALLILALGILLAFLLGVFISKRVLDPIYGLITGTRYLADGHLYHRVDVMGDDEISELAASFNKMAQSIELSRKKLMDYFYDAVKSLVLTLEYRDQYTMGHSEAVADYAEQIAQRLGVEPKTIEMLKKVTLLHDIGKIGVRDNVLNKPGHLTDAEWEKIKVHPLLGLQILKPILDDPNMLSIVRNHHERQDGKGYPDGLQREQVSLLVSIVTVADSYDAMTSDRPYRKAMSQQQAIEILQKGKGSQFHPDVVDAFVETLKSKEDQGKV